MCCWTNQNVSSGCRNFLFLLLGGLLCNWGFGPGCWLLATSSLCPRILFQCKPFMTGQYIAPCYWQQCFLTLSNGTVHCDWAEDLDCARILWYLFYMMSKRYHKMYLHYSLFLWFVIYIYRYFHPFLAPTKKLQLVCFFAVTNRQTQTTTVVLDYFPGWYKYIYYIYFFFRGWELVWFQYWSTSLGQAYLLKLVCCRLAPLLYRSDQSPREAGHVFAFPLETKW